MENQNQKNRHLVMSNKISQESVKDIVKEIFQINTDDDQKEEKYRDWKRYPIKLFINSYGGTVYDGLALVDVIKQSKTPIHTICIGSCMSMALWIWLAGAKRLIGQNGTLMFHDISINPFGKTEEIKQDLNECIRLQKSLVNEIIEKTLITEEKLQDYISRKAEWYISAKEAIELKLADGYYK